jgi:hypothetical protein
VAAPATLLPAKTNGKLACAQKVRPSGRVKAKSVCRDCKSQRFLPVTDEEIAKHLGGLQIMGVYPLVSRQVCDLELILLMPEFMVLSPAKRPER